MGSTQSTSEENYNSSNATANNNIITNNSDPWWPIENNDNFTLEQPNLNEIINEISDLNNGHNNNNNGNINNNSDLNIITKEIDLKIINKNLSEINIIENHDIDSSSFNLPSTSSSLSEVTEEENIKNNKLNSSLSNLKRFNNKEQTLEEFKEELKIKRMARQTAITDLRNELSRLRSQLAEEREINRKLKNGELETCLNKNNNNNKILIDACVSTTDDFPYINNNDLKNENAIIIENTQFEISLKEMVKQLQKDLAETHYNLQMTNSENLTLNSEVGVLKKQVVSLKDVVTCSKQMIQVREEQVTQLKAKLTQIEESLADREAKLLSEDLRREYDKQMENIRNLRQLYEERARVCSAERENLLRQIQIKKDELVAETEKAKHLEERISSLDNDVQVKQTKIEEKYSECSSLKYENRELKEEMNAINLLFSQMLIGFNGNDCLDIDRLTVMLEENRTLLNEMAIKEANNEGASLPKLLFDIVKQANDNDDVVDNGVNTKTSLSETSSECITTSSSLLNDVQNNINSITSVDKEITLLPKIAGIASTNVKQDEQSSVSSTSLSSGSMEVEKAMTTTVMTSSVSKELSNNEDETKEKDIKVNLPNVEQKYLFLEEDKNKTGNVISAQEIIGNLPKVWRVLMELLNHQTIEKVDFIENGQNEECYKSIQTPNGTKSELSVSKTYIKLKNLILEKKSLVKETNRLKTLNSHLEYRLNEQEKRLSAVSLELQKTWHLVGKMQRQHRQLHTHEQILRYQLQQKRRLLTELKEELEYCRRKWAAARAKNMESQLQCDDMRKEFAKRRLEDSNNSAESGYSDSAGSGTDEEEKDFGKNENKSKIPPHKFVHHFIENSRILERRNSLSPARNFLETNLIRWQSSPAVDTPVSFLDEQIANDENFNNLIEPQAPDISMASTSTGAIPKQIADGNEITNNETTFENDPNEPDRAGRIQRLEKQCKSLIARVLETSDHREKLELQIKRFQDEMPPVQHPVPLDDLLENNKRKKSPSPETSSETQETSNRGKLTEREEEYTRRRSERIQRLENESKQLMSTIKKANDRGSTMVVKLKELHARYLNSREGSVDSSADEGDKNGSTTILATTTPETTKMDTTSTETTSITENKTENEKEKLNAEVDNLKTKSESILGRCAERLRRLEEEGQLLLSKWTKTTERGIELEAKLDKTHSRYANKTNSNDSQQNRSDAEEDDDGETETATTSTTASRSDSPKTVEERLKEVEDKANSREERLRQMEIDSKALITKLTKTSNRGSSMIDRIKEGRERRNSLKLEQEKIRKDRQNASIEDENDQIKQDNQLEDVDTKEPVDSRKLTRTTPTVKTLPKTGVAAISLSRQTRSKEQKSIEKPNNSGKSETVEEMFMRLSGLSTTSGNSSQTVDNQNPNESETDNKEAEKTDEKNDNQSTEDKN